MTPETPVVDAEVVTLASERESSQDLVPREAVSLSVTPQIQAGELVERLKMIREAADEAMVEGVDYGKVPGTDKPTLLKPGSEKLGVLFQLDIQPVCEKTWGPGDHLTVVAKATAYHAPTGARLGYGEGVCTTRERKYAYRNQQRMCPSCGVAAIIKGKAEYGGGWVCFKKKGGCNAKFADGASEIVEQTVGEIENPDLPDLWNTVVKMAEKRARVDVVLAVTGASALFTQDMDDHVGEQGLPYGPIASEEIAKSLKRAVAFILSDEVDSDRVTKVLQELTAACDGYMPSIVARSIGHTAAAARDVPTHAPDAPVDDPIADEFTKPLGGSDGQ